eukprot:scpid14517/ scgid15924/ Serine/threonine-protein kinase 17A; DAP kinase-related apoptosis-inducing protein kinase 1
MVEVVKGKATEKYDVGEIIGRGKFSTVKLCTEKDTGKEFAVKILRTARRGCSRDAILNEVRIMNMCVDCMYVLKLVEVFDGGREFHLVEELAECGDLYSRCLAEENHAEENEVRNYIRQLIDALVFIHERNIVHCDIKPENVLVTRDDTDNIRLVDFGLARVVSPKDKVCEIVGTTEYVAPEILSFEPIMAACDMWSLGVLAYTLLSGISPFLGDNDSETYANISHCDYDFDDEVFDHVSEDAQHFISELLEVKPRIRPSAHEMSTHSWMQATIQSPSTSMSTSNTCVVSSSSSVGGVSASTSTTSTSTAIAGGASSSKIDSPIATDGTASSTHKVLTPVNSNQNNLCSSAKTTPTGSPVVSSSSGAFTRGESTRNLSVTVDQSSRGGGSAPNSARRLVGNQHIGVERAASLPVRDRSRLAIDIFSSQDEGANDSMTSATTGNSPTLDTAPDLRETPSAVDSAYMSRHRRSQSCKSLPSTVLIERQDPEESFTYLQEQALRLSDKIEAMLLEKQQQQSRRSFSTSPSSAVVNRSEQIAGLSSTGESSSFTVSAGSAAAATQNTTSGTAPTTPVKKAMRVVLTPLNSPQRALPLVRSPLSAPGTNVVSAPGNPMTDSESPGAKNAATRSFFSVSGARITSTDAAQLLNRVRIHLKSSASISGMRQLERPRGPPISGDLDFCQQRPHGRGSLSSCDDGTGLEYTAGGGGGGSRAHAPCTRVQSVDRFRRRQIRGAGCANLHTNLSANSSLTVNCAECSTCTGDTHAPAGGGAAGGGAATGGKPLPPSHCQCRPVLPSSPLSHDPPVGLGASGAAAASVNYTATHAASEAAAAGHHMTSTPSASSSSSLTSINASSIPHAANVHANSGRKGHGGDGEEGDDIMAPLATYSNQSQHRNSCHSDGSGPCTLSSSSSGISGTPSCLSIEDFSSPELVACYTSELESEMKSSSNSAAGNRGSNAAPPPLALKFKKAAALRQYWTGKLSTFPGVSPFSLALIGLTAGTAAATPAFRLGSDPHMGRHADAAGSIAQSQSTPIAADGGGGGVLERLDNVLTAAHSQNTVPRRQSMPGDTSTSLSSSAAEQPQQQRSSSHPSLVRLDKHRRSSQSASSKQTSAHISPSGSHCDGLLNTAAASHLEQSDFSHVLIRTQSPSVEDAKI